MMLALVAVVAGGCGEPDVASLDQMAGFGAQPAATEMQQAQMVQQPAMQPPVAPEQAEPPAPPTQQPIQTQPEESAMVPTPAAEPVNGAGLGLNTPEPEAPAPQAPDPPATEELSVDGEVEADPAPPVDPDPEPEQMDTGGTFGGGIGGGLPPDDGAADPTTDDAAADDTATDDAMMDDAASDDTPTDDAMTDDSATDDSQDPQTPDGSMGDGCISMPVGEDSGDIGTEAVCYVIPEPIAGWQVSNLASRTLTVNGETVTAPALPDPVDGKYVFEFSAGDPSYTAFGTW